MQDFLAAVNSVMTALINHGARRIIYLDYVETNLAFVRVIFKKNETIKTGERRNMLIAMGLKLLAKKCYGFSPSLY